MKETGPHRVGRAAGGTTGGSTNGHGTKSADFHQTAPAITSAASPADPAPPEHDVKEPSLTSPIAAVQDRSQIDERAHELHKAAQLLSYAAWCSTNASTAHTRSVVATAQRVLRKADRASS
jgi:hypothetical protein